VLRAAILRYIFLSFAGFELFAGFEFNQSSGTGRIGNNALLLDHRRLLMLQGAFLNVLGSVWTIVSVGGALIGEPRPFYDSWGLREMVSKRLGRGRIIEACGSFGRF